MPEMTIEDRIRKLGIAQRASTAPNAEKAEIAARAGRLKEACRIAGGATVVARKIGMPMPTLNNYLAGRDMKASAMVRLAQAAGVSVEWLATGTTDPTSNLHAIRDERVLLDVDAIAAAVASALARKLSV